MEYHIYNYIRNKIQIPFYLRVIFGVFFILISLVPIVLPIFPGSLFLGVFMLVAGLLMIIKAKRIRHVIKIRKGIIHLSKNLLQKGIFKQKWNDILTHVRAIFHQHKTKH